MVGFVEDLPAEWRPQWEQMRKNSQWALPGKLAFNASLLFPRLTPVTRLGMQDSIFALIAFKRISDRGELIRQQPTIEVKAGEKV